MSETEFTSFTIKANAIALVALVPVAWLIGGLTAALAATIGGLAGMGNIAAMSWSVKRLLSSASAGGKPVYGLLIVIKFMAMMILVWAAVSVFGLDPIGLSLGFTSMVLALLISSVVFSTNVEIEENGSEG